VSAAGAVLVLTGRYALDQAGITVAGAVLLVAAALVNGARCRKAKLAPGVGLARP
jgi:hypothetical protein